MSTAVSEAKTEGAEAHGQGGVEETSRFGPMEHGVSDMSVDPLQHSTDATSPPSTSLSSTSAEDGSLQPPPLLVTALTSAPISTPAQQPSAEASAPAIRSRRSSQFQSSRPAPPSPAPSRRTSQIHSPALSSRDRASSTSSSAGQLNLGQSVTSSAGAATGVSGASTAGSLASGNVASASGSGGSTGALARKLSQNQGQLQSVSGLGKRGSIAKARPRSSLGTAMYTDADNGSDSPGRDHGQTHSALSPTSGSSTSGTFMPDSSTTQSIPAAQTGAAPASDIPSGPSLASTAGTSVSPSASPSRGVSNVSLPLVVVVKDYAFPPSDERHHGRGQPEVPANSSSSRLSSYLQSANAASSSDRRHSTSGSSSGAGEKKGGWSFSLLGWKGFMGSGRKSRSNSQSEDGSSSRAVSASGRAHRDHDAESEPDLLAVGDVTTADDYAFESSSEDDEEPFGLYRAAYPFEPEGEHEIELEEGEIVEVRGRGVGEGWVVAIKLKRRAADGATVAGLGISPSDQPGAGLGGTGGPVSGEKEETIEGLVPEGYLEKVDEEEVRRGMIYAGYQGAQRRTVAPDGISEEPEETSDSESGPGR